MADDVRDLIGALEQGDMAQANNVWQDAIGSRVQDALDARKIAVTGEVFGTSDEIDADMDISDEEIESNMDDEEVEFEEDEVDFDEEEVPEED